MQALDVPVSFLFDDMPDGIGSARLSLEPVDDLLGSREPLELVRSYCQLSEGVRHALRHLVRAMVAGGAAEE